MIEIVEFPQYLLDEPADYVFITSESLEPGTQQLADLRVSTGFSTQVITVEDLYNHFTYGIRHPIAIKEYFRFLLENYSQLPIYALLVGDGHWNLKASPSYPNPSQHMLPNMVWVDPWQGEVDSANLLATVIGDDPIADISIARLPVNGNEELTSYVNKIVEYENNSTPGWKNNYLFVADNTPDTAGDFVQLSENVINEFFSPPSGRNVIRLYQNDFINNIQGIRDSIVGSINDPGVMIVNYIGHGSINLWASDGIFRYADIESLNNLTNYPIFLSMTCLDGYWIRPDVTGLIEELIRSSDKGAIAAFSPTGLGVATGHDVLHKGLYEALFTMRVVKLGQMGDYAKLTLYQSGISPDLIQTFTVFGDPYLTVPTHQSIHLPVIRK